jgi:hypothetical protein
MACNRDIFTFTYIYLYKCAVLNIRGQCNVEVTCIPLVASYWPCTEFAAQFSVFVLTLRVVPADSLSLWPLLVSELSYVLVLTSFHFMSTLAKVVIRLNMLLILHQ